MALFSTYDKLANTIARNLDQKLWGALMPKHPLLDMVARPSTDGVQKFEWEVDVAPVRVYVAAASGTTIDGTNTADANLALTGGKLIPVGSIIRNASIATPIGTAGQDELMLVTSNNAAEPAILAMTRNTGAAYGATADVGSAAHLDSHSYEVLYSPLLEGSSFGRNMYTDVTLVSNIVNMIDFNLSVTGDQLHQKAAVAGDSLANQTAKCMLNLANDMERMLLYGTANPVTPSLTVPKRTVGIDQFITVANGNIDWTTLAFTSDALNTRLQKIIEGNSDPNDRYIVVGHPTNIAKAAAWGAENVTVGQDVTKYGRTIDTFKSALGVQVPLIWTLNCTKSDVFILDMDKISMPVFRPFEKAEVTYADDGTDSWRQRYLTSLGVKVVDPLYSHAKIGKITWT